MWPGQGEHRDRQLGFRRETYVSGDPGLRAPTAVLGPHFGQVQLSIDQCLTRRARVGEEHPDLAALDLARSTRVLAEQRYSSLPLRVAVFRRMSREMVDGDRPMRSAIVRILNPSATMTAISSRSEKSR